MIPLHRSSFTGITVVVAVLLALQACSERPKVAPLPTAAKVVALGDSLTFGTGASGDSAYPVVLSSLTGWEVLNAGFPGETAAEGCARMPALLDEHRPQLVLVLLGGNDFLRRAPEQAIRDGLAACVSSARTSGTPVVLLTVPRFGIGGLAVSPLYAETGSALAVPVIDSGLSDLLARPSLRADHVHLNADGYRALAENVAAGLRKQGFLAR